MRRFNRTSSVVLLALRKRGASMHAQWLLLACVSVNAITVPDRPTGRARHRNVQLEGSWVLVSVREGDGKDIKMQDLQDGVRRWCKGLWLTFARGRVWMRTAAEPKPK